MSQLLTVYAEIPGKYELIPPMQTPAANSLDQVQIDEVFAFSCGYCDKFHKSTYPRLKKRFGDKIKFVFRPVGWLGHDPGRLYYIAEEKGKGEGAMTMIFNLIHEGGLGRQMYDRDKLQFVAKKLGLSNEFKTRMDDEVIVRKMNGSVQWAADRNIDSTPTLVIEKSLKVNRDFNNMVTVINSLLKEPVK
jgi:predicted DsbA family dithiol-disulfide isomerase